MDAVLALSLALVCAVVALPGLWLVAWGASGGDGEQPNVVAGVLVMAAPTVLAVLALIAAGPRLWRSTHAITSPPRTSVPWAGPGRVRLRRATAPPSVGTPACHCRRSAGRRPPALRLGAGHLLTAASASSLAGPADTGPLTVPDAPQMPELTVATSLDGIDAETLVVPVFRGAIAGAGADVALEMLGLDEVPRTADFRGRVGEVGAVASPGSTFGRVVFVGLGRMDELTPETVRRAAGAAARALLPSTTTVATTLAQVDPTLAYVRAVAEGLLLGAHRDDRFRSSPGPRRLQQVTLVVPSSLEDSATEVLAQARAHAQGQIHTRELVTTPAGHLGPQDVVDWATANLPDGLEIEVWDEERLAAEHCGGMLAVGKGSIRPPRMLIVRYRPENPVAHVAMIGKGIVFDSGGLSLKPPEGMEHMKDDMGGAAVVLGVLGALPALSPTVAVTGYCALAENMPSGSAQRPGDVFTARNGTTVQVLNTDAEGRLVMADALSLAAESDADAIIDVATLTGAVSHAVGRRAIGVFGNDDDLLRQVLAAAEDAGESAWHLPLWEDLREGLESDIADLDNIAREDRGGATIAGLFLREFVDDVPWVHLDVAGAMWATAARGHVPSQATGAGVRTILRWLEVSHA